MGCRLRFLTNPALPRALHLMRRSLNVRFLLCLLAGLAVVVLTCHCTHAWQVRRNAWALLAHAARAEEHGRLQQAAAYLGSYLVFVPEDTETLARYALTLEKLPDSGGAHRRAVAVMEQVLRREPGRQDVRKALVRVAFDLGLYAEARGHLVTLLESAPHAAELERLLAWCDEAAGEYASAADWLRKAVAHAPDHVEGNVRLASLLRVRLDEAGQADQVMDALIAANAGSVAAHLARASYRREHGLLAEAGEDLARARALAPDDAAVLLTFADWANAAGNVAQAEAALVQGIARAPQNAALHLALARLLFDSGRPRQALDRLREGLHRVPGQPDLLFLLAQALIQEREFTAAASAAGQLGHAGAPAELLRYLEAQVLLHREQWSEAAALLEDVRVQLTAPQVAFQSDLALGHCYSRLGEAARSVAAYRRAVATGPTSAAARAGLALALAEAGQTDEALAECRRAVARPGAQGFAWTAQARLLIARNLRLPESRRDWTEAEAALARVEQRTPDALDVALLRAEILAARGELERAQSLLERARDRHSDNPAPWCALAALARTQGRPEGALGVLDLAEGRLGSHVELFRARVRFWAGQGGAGALPALAALEQGSAAFPRARLTALLRELAEARYRLGDMAGAERVCKRLAEADPNDQPSRLLLVDLYLHRGDAPGLDRVLAGLREVAGDGGVWWGYAEAARLLLTAPPGDAKSLSQARALLAEVSRRHPSWPRVALLEAFADEREGNLDRATETYLRAVERGERQQRVVSRLASLLWERRRFAEVDQLLRTLEEEGSLTGDLARLAAESALALGDRGRAIALAQRSVTGDYREQLWVAHVFHQAGQSRQAEHVLRAALKRTARAPDIWVALVGLLAAAGQRDRASAAMLEAQAALPEQHCSLTLARCYELLGQKAEAEEQYRIAVEMRPDDFLVLHQVAGFYVRAGIFARAQAHLRKLCAPDVQAPAEHAAWARRQLAEGLATAGREQGFEEALALLNSNAALTGETLDDQRARARVLATRRERRPEALRLLTATLPRAPLVARDRLLLAQLHEAASDVPRAREEMLALLAAEGHDPKYLVHYVRCLRRWGDQDEARVWAARLKELDAQAYSTLQEDDSGVHRTNP